MMRSAPFISLFLLASCVGYAAPASTTATSDDQQRREQAELAALVATERLRAEVLQSPMAVGVSAEQLAIQLGALERLQRVIERAEQVGGPRWPEPQVCQVRVELSGAVVADELMSIARELGGAAPLSLEQVQHAVAPLRTRAFAASGLSVAGTALERLPFDPTGPWGAVSPEARGQAVHAARRAAIDQVVRTLDAVSLPDGSKLGERRRADEQFDRTVRAFLDTRPVVPLGLDDDLTVRVAVAVPVEALSESLRDLVPGADAAEYRARLAAQLRQQPPLMIGSAKAVAPEPHPPVDAGPRQTVPEWSRELILIEGEAPAGATRLQTLRAAEHEARARLRNAVLALPMPDGTTLSQQATARPSVAEAVERSLALTNTARVTFRADGSASVQVVLDGRTLWQSIVDAGR